MSSAATPADDGASGEIESTGATQAKGTFAKEMKKVLPLGLMFFFILFNYTILRDTKDVLVVTAPKSGAEIIPFLKTYVNLPGAVAFTVLYSRLTNRYSRENVFYICVVPFILFFVAFAYFVYPARMALHPNALCDALAALLPAGFGAPIGIIRCAARRCATARGLRRAPAHLPAALSRARARSRARVAPSAPCGRWRRHSNWTYAVFYTMAELWGSVVASLLFWGFANEVTTVDEAKKYYPLFGLGANVALIFSGQVCTRAPAAHVRVCVCVRGGARACVRACVRQCVAVRQCVRAAVCVCSGARVCARAGGGEGGWRQRRPREWRVLWPHGTRRGARRGPHPPTAAGARVPAAPHGQAVRALTPTPPLRACARAGARSRARASARPRRHRRPVRAQYVRYVSGLRRTWGAASGIDPWGRSLNYLMSAVAVSGAAILGLFRYIQTRVITDPDCMDVTQTKKAKTKTKMGLRESAAYLAQSKYIRNLAMLVIAYGMSINIVEVSWKSKLKQAFPNPNDYSEFMGMFSTVTGAATLVMMLLGRRIFKVFGWGVASLVTPLVLAATGGAFFGCARTRARAGASAQAPKRKRPSASAGPPWPGARATPAASDGTRAPPPRAAPSGGDLAAISPVATPPARRARARASPA